MPKIPLMPPNRISDEIAPGVGGVELLDGFCDQVGEGDWALNRRGGLWPWWLTDTPVKIDGLYWWDNRGVLLVVTAGHVFVFTDLITAPTKITGAQVQLNHNVSANFETSGSWVFITTSGSKPIMWDGNLTHVAQFILNAPQTDSFAFSNGNVLLHATGTNEVHRVVAVVNSTDTPTYKLGEWFTPDANPDKLLSIDSRYGTVLLFGPQSVEFFAYDGTISDPEVPFTKIAGLNAEWGMASTKTLAFYEGAHFWLTPERKIVKMVGTAVDVISKPFESVLHKMTCVDDAYGFIVDQRFYCIAFPTDDFCFVYDFNNGAWYKWCWFNSGQYSRFLGSCSAYSPKWGVQFIGSRLEGQVMIYHQDLVTDLLINPVRMLYRTAHIDHGTMEPKQCNKLMLRLRRGV